MQSFGNTFRYANAHLIHLCVLLTATLACTRQADRHLFIVGRKRHPESISSGVFGVDCFAEMECTTITAGTIICDTKCLSGLSELTTQKSYQSNNRRPYFVHKSSVTLTVEVSKIVWNCFECETTK